MSKEGDKYVRGRRFVVHPDVEEAYLGYDPDTNNSFRDMIKRREEKIKEGEDYWETDHDIEMRQTAEERTARCLVGRPFPGNAKKR